MKEKELQLQEIEVSHTLGEPILVVYCEWLVYYEGVHRELKPMNLHVSHTLGDVGDWNT
jgi:hypothetical protein